MAGLNQTAANGMLNTLLSGSLQLRLYTVAPTPTTAGTEVAGAGYLPQGITFGAASAGSITQAGTVTFPAATAAYSAPVVAWCITDTSNNQKVFLSFTSITVNSGDQITFPAGTIVVSLA